MGGEGLKTQPEVIGIGPTDSNEEIQLAKSPQPVNHFRPTVCPSVTILTDKHG